MKIAIILFLFACTVFLYFDNLYLKKRLEIKPSYYQTNLTREEMKEVLHESINDTIALVIPGDTSIMPYLIKQNKAVQCDLVSAGY